MILKNRPQENVRTPLALHLEELTSAPMRFEVTSSETLVTTLILTDYLSLRTLILMNIEDADQKSFAAEWTLFPSKLAQIDVLLK